MTLIRKVPNSIVQNADQVPQNENPSQPPPLQNTPLGIADNTDQFESAPQSLYYLDQQAQNASLIQPTTTREIAVEASSLFNSYEPNVSLFDNRLPQLQDRFNSLNEKKDELQSKIQAAEADLSKAQDALDKVTKLMDSNLPMTDELRSILEPVGLWEKMAEKISGLPLVSTFGMNLFRKEKLREVKSELEQKIQGIAINIESLKSEKAGIENEMNSVSDQIQNEKERQAKATSPYQFRDPITETETIVAQDQVSQTLYNQELIQKQTPAAVPFNEIATSLNEDLFKKTE